MSDRTLEERLAAVERAVTDGECDLDGADAATVTGDPDGLEERLSEVESRLADLEAAVQAVRGYVGNVRQVDRELERRADAALAKAEAVEERVAAVEDGPGAGPPDRRPVGREFARPGASGAPEAVDVAHEDDGDDGDLLARLCGSL